jgi:hypothetical protein
MKTDDTVHKLNSKRTTPSADIKSKGDETGMNNCLWTVSSLADGALCIFVSFLTDGVFRFFM